MDTSFQALLSKLDSNEQGVLTELDRRLVLARALLQKHLPELDVSPKDDADLLFEFFERVDDFLDSLDDDDDDDDDD